MHTNTNNKTAALKRNILGIVATACLRNIAQAPAANNTNLNASETKRPLHSAPHANNASLCCWLTLVPGFKAVKTPESKLSQLITEIKKKHVKYTLTEFWQNNHGQRAEKCSSWNEGCQSWPDKPLTSKTKAHFIFICPLTDIFIRFWLFRSVPCNRCSILTPIFILQLKTLEAYINILKSSMHWNYLGYIYLR